MLLLFVLLLILSNVIYTGAITRDNDVGNIRLAFGIMIYQRHDNTLDETIACFMRLIDVIYNERHVYVLHIDIKSDPALIDSLNEYCNQRENCYTIEPRNVAWAGSTISEMMLAVMQKAFEVDNFSSNPWDYFLLMGHDTLPIVTLPYMETFLSDTLSTSIDTNDVSDDTKYRGRNFIYCWEVSGHDFFGQWEDNTWRLEIPVIDTMDGHLIEDVQTTRYDDHHKHHHHYHPRRHPLHGIDFRKSLQHCVLTRDFVKYAIYSSEARRIFLFLANVKNSDENILPTILFTNPPLAATATCNNTLHFNHWIRPGGSWHPEVLGLEHLPLLLSQTQKFFIRKINSQKSVDLATILERIRNEYNSLYDSSDESPLITKDNIIEQLSWILPIAKEYIFKNYHSYRGHVKEMIDAFYDGSTSCNSSNNSNDDSSNELSSCVTTESPRTVLELLDNIRKDYDRNESEQFERWWHEHHQRNHDRNKDNDSNENHDENDSDNSNDNVINTDNTESSDQ